MKAGPAVEHVLDRLDEVVPARQPRRLLAHGRHEIVDQRPAYGAGRTASRSSGLLPLIERSMANSASMRRTTSMAIGESGISFFPEALRRAFSSISAIAKNGRACMHPACVRVSPGKEDGCDLKPFKATQRVRRPPGKGGARQPEASLARATATAS